MEKLYEMAFNKFSMVENLVHFRLLTQTYIVMYKLENIVTKFFLSLNNLQQRRGKENILKKINILIDPIFWSSL